MIDKIRLFIYNFLFLYPFSGVMLCAALFNAKIKRGIEGRRNWETKLQLLVNALDSKKKTIWFHSASLGEFEQAKPIIEKIKAEYSCNIIVTFFSPSGLENSLKYPHADIKTYIPADSPKNVKRFLDIVTPAVAVIMRYDIWPNFVYAMHKREIPIYLVDATMRKNSARLSFFMKGFHQSLFEKFTKILTVTKEDAENFKLFDCPDNQLIIAGDSKFDRVYARSLVARQRNLLRKDVTSGRRVIVAGSIHRDDEDVLIPVLKKLYNYNNDILTILVPHEPTIQNIEELENSFLNYQKTIRFSFMNNYAGEKIIIVDSIGVLLLLYFYADIAFIGGSYSGNVHNALEAAVYNIPVVYGPKIHHSADVQKLTAIGGGVIARTKKELYRTLSKFLKNELERDRVGKISGEFIREHVGSTEKIVKVIMDNSITKNRVNDGMYG